MGILSFLRKKQSSKLKMPTYSGRAVVYNDSKTGRGQDKAVLWFPDSQGKILSIGQKLKKMGIDLTQVQSVSRIAYCPNQEDILKRFSIVAYSSERNLKQVGENGRFDIQKTKAKEEMMKMQDARLILDTARQMKRLPTHLEYAGMYHPLKTPERAWRLFERKNER